MSIRPHRILAITALLATTAFAALPAAAAGPLQETTAGSHSGTSGGAASDDVRIIVAQSDADQSIMADDDDDDDGTQTAGMDRYHRRAQGSPGEESRQGAGRDRDRDDRGDWDHARNGGRRGGETDHRALSDSGGNDGRWTPERRRMMAMHGRMMQMMQGQRQQSAGFRIETGNTKLAVKCSPRETMRECVDAAVSLATRLRDSGSKPSAGAEGGAAASPNPPAIGQGSGQPQ